jgi:hypothetical protein
VCVAEELSNRRFKIAGGKAGMKIHMKCKPYLMPTRLTEYLLNGASDGSKSRRQSRRLPAEAGK